MIKRNKIDFTQFNTNIFNLFNDWMLLTCGSKKKFNSMTIAWGSIGVMWKLPVIIVGVRPERYTYEFFEKFYSFTVTVFDEEYKKALSIMGSKSGRDIDKVKETGLTPLPSTVIDAPGYDQANLIMECETVYKDDLKKECSLEPVINYYKERNYHRFYIEEIKAIYGTEAYNCNK